MPGKLVRNQTVTRHRTWISIHLALVVVSFGVSGLIIAAALIGGGRKATLPVEPTLDQLAQRYTPLWYQDVDNSDTRADYITRANFDGDWLMADNWEEMPNYPLTATIYWSGVETSSHWFIVYAAYHPRDWDEVCGGPICHENDLEGIQLAIRKDGSTYGRIEVAETIFHWDIHKFYDAATVTPRAGVPNLAPGIVIDPDGRPRVFMEAKGHGVTMQSTTLNPGYVFPGGDGVVYRHDGIAAEPTGANLTYPYVLVSYELAPLKEILWARHGDLGDAHTFDAPFIFSGARFRAGDTIGGAFDGDNHDNDLAKPPWGWDDALTSVYQGDWAIDPAYTFQEHFIFAQAVNSIYTNNFYLTDLGSNLAIDATSASQYLVEVGHGPTGTNIDCEDNNDNKWCIEVGTPHWPPNAIGCYEIADDSGSQDCQPNNLHSNTIAFDWRGEAIRQDALDAIIVRTNTAPNVCANVPGYENDGDGWNYGTPLTQVLRPAAWSGYTCQQGGSFGPYQWRGLFTADGYLDGFEVRAGDHYDEGQFKVQDITLDFKSTCADGTIEGLCSSERPFQCQNGILTATCGSCGCPGGTVCSSSGACVEPNKKKQEVAPIESPAGG